MSIQYISCAIIPIFTWMINYNAKFCKIPTHWLTYILVLQTAIVQFFFFLMNYDYYSFDLKYLFIQFNETTYINKG